MGEIVPSKKYSIYGAITEKIVRAIRESATTFKMPWHASREPLAFPVNAKTEFPYRGVNVLSLWVDAIVKGFGTGYWASYRQWQAMGAQVRYGERGSLIFFYKKLDLQGSDEVADDVRRYVGKASWVFNASQVDDWTPPPPRQSSAVEIDATVAAVVEAVEARVYHGYRTARYRPDLDCIEMPSPSWFFDTETRTAAQAYHAVLFHEMTHWTGPSHRCNREFGKRFGDQAYAFEELVAELGAAFLCAAFKIANEPRPDHAAYVASWLQILGNDPKAVFTAASRAHEAAEFLFALASAKLDNLPTTAEVAEP